MRVALRSTVLRALHLLANLVFDHFVPSRPVALRILKVSGFAGVSASLAPCPADCLPFGGGKAEDSFQQAVPEGLVPERRLAALDASSKVGPVVGLFPGGTQPSEAGNMHEQPTLPGSCS